jgi:hypothetical protein
MFLIQLLQMIKLMVLHNPVYMAEEEYTDIDFLYN